MRYIFFLCGCLLLSGCNPFGWAKEGNQKILTQGWAMSDPLPEPAPLHCYKTLGEKICYDTEQPHKEHQLLGEYTPYVPPYKKNTIEKIFLD